MRQYIRFLIAIVFFGAAPGVFAQGILFPLPHPRMPSPRPIPGPHSLKVKSLKIDTQIQGQVVTFTFGSEVLLTAISSDKQLAAYASLGENVVVVHKGKLYRIHD